MNSDNSEFDDVFIQKASLDFEWVVLKELIEFNSKEKIHHNIPDIYKIFSYHPYRGEDNKDSFQLGLAPYDFIGPNSIVNEINFNVNLNASTQSIYNWFSNMRQKKILLEIATLKSRTKTEKTLYFLTYNGLIFSLCRLNTDYKFTNTIITEFRKYWKFNSENLKSSLLNNFLNLSLQEKEVYIRKFVELYDEETSLLNFKVDESFDEFNSESYEFPNQDIENIYEKYEEIYEISNIFYEMENKESDILYNSFMLFPLILSEDNEINFIAHKIWATEINTLNKFFNEYFKSELESLISGFINLAKKLKIKFDKSNIIDFINRFSQ
ncbi:MAG: hypothetical protein JXA54_06760 [Candidatus Heimdallarchaeota archaeon]|nr:hypothetical protein [Candidatus Heimdallarchaeota archaeon]